MYFNYGASSPPHHAAVRRANGSASPLPPIEPPPRTTKVETREKGASDPFNAFEWDPSTDLPFFPPTTPSREPEHLWSTNMASSAVLHPVPSPPLPQSRSPQPSFLSSFLPPPPAEHKLSPKSVPFEPSHFPSTPSRMSKGYEQPTYDDRPAHDDRHVNSVNSAFGGLYLGKGGSPPDERGRDGMGSPLFQYGNNFPNSPNAYGHAPRPPRSPLAMYAAPSYGAVSSQTAPAYYPASPMREHYRGDEDSCLYPPEDQHRSPGIARLSSSVPSPHPTSSSLTPNSAYSPSSSPVRSSLQTLSLPPSPSPPHTHVYNVQFKRGQRSFVLPSTLAYSKVGAYVVVEADRGEDLGVVVTKIAADKFNRSFTAGRRPAGKSPRSNGGDGGLAGELKKILRLASNNEVQQLVEKKEEEAALVKICRAKVRQRALRMEVVDAEYQFDRHKLTFFFQAEGRIDFRELVRDLFSIYKTRIWMQQLDKVTGKLLDLADLENSD